MKNLLRALPAALSVLILGIPAALPATTKTVCPVVWPEENLLLGGTVDGEWATDEQAAPRLRGGEEYQLYTLTKRLGPATGTKPRQGEEGEGPCWWAFQIQIRPLPRESEVILAIGAKWNALPRVPRIESTDQIVHHDAVRAILQEHGISAAEVNITRVLRVDLEGDGVDEVLINATNERPGRIYNLTQKGDYSMVVLRRLSGGKVENIVLSAQYWPDEPDMDAPASPDTATVPAVLDFNGDGVLEVAVHWQHREGTGITVFEVRGDNVEQAFGTGLGA
jgi:hypothetical protein